MQRQSISAVMKFRAALIVAFAREGDTICVRSMPEVKVVPVPERMITFWEGLLEREMSAVVSAL